MKKQIPKKRGPQKGSKLLQIQRTQIGERIFSARRSQGISQKRLGEKTGLTLRAISYYERESDNIPAPVIKKISDALNVTTSYLLNESPQKKIKDDMSPKFRKHFETLKKLSKKDQDAVFRMIDGLATKEGISEEQSKL